MRAFDNWGTRLRAFGVSKENYDVNVKHEFNDGAGCAVYPSREVTPLPITGPDACDTFPSLRTRMTKQLAKIWCDFRLICKLQKTSTANSC